ncbi:ArgP/LysG family DNA-binding transcriptional regulator, partial [Escherichia sp. HC-TM1]
MAKVSLEKDKIKFLLVEGVHQKALESLRAAGYTNIEFHKGALDDEQLKESIRDAHFIGLRSRTHLTEDVINAAEKLVAIGCFCIGTNQVDLDAAAKRGIPVFNAPFSNTRSVAELVIGELLLLLRGVPEANAKAHRGVWNKLAAGSFEARGKKLGITQSAVSQRIKQLENMFGQPLLVRTVPPRPTEQGQKLLALLRQVELLEEEWLGDEQTGSTPLLLSLAVNADSLATWLLPALAPVLADSPIRLNLQVEDETRTQERLRRGEVVGAVSIQHQALPSCLVDKLGALDYLFVSSKPFAEKYFPNGVTRSALLKAPVVAFDHLDDMHQAFLQQNFDLPPGSVPCHIVNSSEAFVQLARQGTTCCMIPHLQIEKELASGELIDLTPGLFQRRMLYWHRFAPESRMMRKVTDALL